MLIPKDQRLGSRLSTSSKKNLSALKRKHLYIEGRLVFLNSVLSSLLVFFFSFYKAPKKVITKLSQIQGNFLWGGDYKSSKVCYVKWDIVCSLKEEGGIDVKNLFLFNLVLLNKW